MTEWYSILIAVLALGGFCIALSMIDYGRRLIAAIEENTRLLEQIADHLRDR